MSVIVDTNITLQKIKSELAGKPEDQALEVQMLIAKNLGYIAHELQNARVDALKRGV